MISANESWTQLTGLSGADITVIIVAGCAVLGLWLWLMLRNN